MHQIDMPMDYHVGPMRVSDVTDTGQSNITDLKDCFVDDME